MMKFLSVRDLKTKSSLVWKELSDQKDMIITSNGRPIAILSSITEDNLEEVLSSFRQARAMQAVNAIQYASVRKGTDNISMDEIDDEIRATRSEQKK
jgi:antitoxin (DNA-binding transcriptional repressor) of toxin-antitoxin stability system